MFAVVLIMKIWSDIMINYLNISFNSLVLALIALVFVLILLVVILIIKSNNNNSSNVSFLDDNSDSKSITNIDIDEFKSSSSDIAKKIEIPKEESKPKFNLDEVTKQMQQDINNDNIDLTEFEIEQEEKSIISYKELLSKVNKDKMIMQQKEEKNIADDEYNYATEVLDFDTDLNEELNKQKKIELEQEKNTILNIDDNSDNDTSHELFLKSLKTLKDNLV